MAAEIRSQVKIGSIPRLRGLKLPHISGWRWMGLNDKIKMMKIAICI